MHSSEFDFRYEWTSITLRALRSGFENIRKKSEDEPWCDGLWQLENAESILGIAYVIAQAYILGVVEDVNKIRDSAGKKPIDKIKYYSDDAQPLPNGTSRILLINALANYYGSLGISVMNRQFWRQLHCRPPAVQLLAQRSRQIPESHYYKHHDEWNPRWQTNPTTKTLSAVGIFDETEFPCYHATTKLWNENELENLENLLSIISEWRKYIISKYQ